MRHRDLERLIDGLVTDAQSEDEASVGGVGNQRRPLSAGVRMAQVDIGDPRPHLDAGGGLTHELGGGHDVAVDLGGKDCVETGRLGFLSNRANLRRAPTYSGTTARPNRSAIVTAFRAVPRRCAMVLVLASRPLTILSR